ncbi:MAG: DUF1887 family protein [Gammaproteobacteria bacterium]|nr:DUF1887 family protein [Gammaproteobacteria bacterium]
MNLHICLISDQLFANYLPIKLERPDKVFIIGTQYTENKGLNSRFEKLLDGLGIAYQRANTFAPADDFTQLSEYFLELSNEIEVLNPSQITLNLTGGTKLMAIAANEMLRTDSTRVIYTNTQAGKIDIINEGETDISLPSLLTIDEYLTSYGVSPKSYNSQDDEWIATAQDRKSLTKLFVEYFAKDKAFLGTLNYYVQRAVEKKPNSNDVLLKYPKQQLNNLNKNRIALLKKITDCGLVDIDEESATIYFKSAEAAQYLGGFWLEEYAYFIAVDIGIDEVRCGQNIQWDKKTRNELDIVLVHNNRLMIMECKTRNYGKNEAKDNDSIYKLDSVAEDLRGLYGEKWLLSVDNVDDRADKRAKSQGIRFIAGNNLKNLQDELIKWRDK